MSANIEFLVLSPVTYEEKHSDDKYEIVKFEVQTDEGRFHKLSFPQYGSKRGVEGLLGGAASKILIMLEPVAP
jgi:hypothetical protein